MKSEGDTAQRKAGWFGIVAAFAFFLLAAPCLANELPSAASPLSEGASLLSGIGKVFGALLVVVGLMLVVLYLIKRAGLGVGRGRSGSAIAVLESRMVAPKKYVAIVEIADKCLALGITDHSISLLADLGPEAKAALARQATTVKPGATFAGLLAQSMKSWQAAAPTSSGLAGKGDKEAQDSP